MTGIATGEAEWALARVIVQPGRSLGKQLLAEGVETAEQLAQLRALGCPTAQGYLCSPPLPAPDFEARFLADDRVVLAPPAPKPA